MVISLLAHSRDCDFDQPVDRMLAIQAFAQRIHGEGNASTSTLRMSFTISIKYIYNIREYSGLKSYR
jgi:hypothetical protein